MLFAGGAKWEDRPEGGSGAHRISVRSFRFSPPLEACFTGLYVVRVDGRPGEHVTDFLHPEWVSLRFVEGEPLLAGVGGAALASQPPFLANGPINQAIRLGMANCRMWAIGLRPAGWARFVAAGADALVNRIADGSAHPALSVFAPLLGRIRAGGGNVDAVARQIDEYLLGLLHRPAPQEAQVIACQEALRDPEITGVAQLCERVGMSQRSLERLCQRYLVFPPKMLLRRQRFMRSLTQFLRDPSLAWIDAIDRQYHDQAQFVREFRSFMGITPSRFAAMPHPILGAIMRNRFPDRDLAEPLPPPPPPAATRVRQAADGPRAGAAGD